VCAADGRCVACVSNADCAQGECDTVANRCLAASAVSCSALSSFLEVNTGTIRLRGATLSGANDTALSCAIAGTNGPDIVYGLRLTQPKRLTATVRPLDKSAGFQPVIALRRECARAEEIGCGFANAGSDRASLVADGLAVGTYFLWIDSESEVGGEFELEVSLDDPPRIDTCGSPGVLRVVDSIEVEGETVGLADDVALSCGASQTPDAVYSLTLDRPRRVRVEALGSSGFRPAVALRTACAQIASEQACGSATSVSTPAVVELPLLDRGEYAILVDSAVESAGAGRFRLKVTLSEPVPSPTNDACATALEIPVTLPSTSVSLPGDTTRAKNDATGCDGTGPELVYSLQLSEPRQLIAKVTPFAGSRLKPVIYLRREMYCDSNLLRDQLFCSGAGQAGFPAQFQVPRLEAGRYYLFVDGRQGSSGAFDLAIEVSAPPLPPANDTCAMPTVLSLASGSVDRPNETTIGASASALTCVPVATPDVAYSFSLSTRQSLSVDAKAHPGSRLLPVVSLKPMGSCLSTSLSFPTRCAFSDDQVSDRAVGVFPNLEPGTYTLWVSGDLATQGPFSLRLSTGPPLTAPANDVCVANGMSFSLGFGSSVSGDTRAAGNTTEGRCGFPAGANGEFGADVAYTFVVTNSQQRNLTITVQPDSNDGQLMRPVVYVRGGPANGNMCTSQGSNLGCQVAPDFGTPVSLSLTNLAVGTYTLWVDGAGVSAGAFQLTLR
jgi:hypothetical protein